MSQNYLRTVPPQYPTRAMIIRPDPKLPKYCSSSIWLGLLYSPCRWLLALFTSKPFPKPNDGCTTCVDRNLLYYKGKTIRMNNSFGTGTITAIHHFQNEEAILTVEGPKVNTTGNVAYVATPRDHVTLNLVDEIRFRLTPKNDNVYRGDYIWVEREDRDLLESPESGRNKIKPEQ
ncbi:hypothetical protein QCA50_008062 [Cerrena zonata]|uniref:Uncharacterized protein n=1 Tax=Cerrena zonata TaxID=2478898 RepID=A0AAW0GEW2_9APHY